jgi:hypothetical protein
MYAILYHIFQRNILNKSCIFLEHLLLHIISGPYISGTSVTPTSQIHMSIMLILLTLKVWLAWLSYKIS